MANNLILAISFGLKLTKNFNRSGEINNHYGSGSRGQKSKMTAAIAGLRVFRDKNTAYRLQAGYYGSITSKMLNCSLVRWKDLGLIEFFFSFLFNEKAQTFLHRRKVLKTTKQI